MMPLFRKLSDLDWMCSRLLSAVLSHASVMFSISERSRRSSSLFRGLSRPGRNQKTPAQLYSCSQDKMLICPHKNQRPVASTVVSTLTSNVSFVTVIDLL